ncbi:MULTISPECIES: imidazoleglycerol-phosphate dehydratase [unclassified Yoonia]|uniref:imidazoleglycerol-phosphate dehydratase n=1 Tax=unclassified Yoonia TaxID=2629118 RepID=UPI002AFFC568|nr:MULTISPECIES: imidazoleglycerol-phosphate dehydratase [unclassified Yoonia]
MKAMILRDDAADAVQTAHILANKGFQTLCVTSRDIAQAMIRADVIDLMVMDERIGMQLTHTLALSAERRNPFVSTIIMTDKGAEATDDLYGLIPSLYALVGTRTGPDILGKIVLSAIANTEEVARRIDRHLAAEAAELALPEDDFDLLAEDDDVSIWDEADDEDEDHDDTADVIFAAPALDEIGQNRSRGWGDFADVRPHLVMTPPALPPRDAAVKVCA